MGESLAPNLGAALRRSAMRGCALNRLAPDVVVPSVERVVARRGVGESVLPKLPEEVQTGGTVGVAESPDEMEHRESRLSARRRMRR